MEILKEKIKQQKAKNSEKKIAIASGVEVACSPVAFNLSFASNVSNVLVSHIWHYLGIQKLIPYIRQSREAPMDTVSVSCRVGLLLWRQHLSLSQRVNWCVCILSHLRQCRYVDEMHRHLTYRLHHILCNIEETPVGAYINSLCSVCYRESLHCASYCIGIFPSYCPDHFTDTIIRRKMQNMTSKININKKKILRKSYSWAGDMLIKKTMVFRGSTFSVTHLDHVLITLL